jgi:hypothetical protein
LSTAVREQPAQFRQTEPLRRPSRWLRRGTISVLLLIAVIWSGDAAISFLVQHTRLRSRFTARLAAAFGRAVEVGSYSFSIWGGPVVGAHSVRIGEDPRFGNEYFIHADSISVGLRWWGLLRGHVELGTLSVSGASLNLVRSPDGDWNLAEWLPRPPAGASSAPANAPVASQPAVQFRRIDIANSRIDFKRGYEKLAVALVNVNGSMETEAPGRWRIAMTASPWRAAVLTQQPGVISVTGHIGGTSSRLRPAALEISWTGASISDLFRLARGDDYGIRGDVAASISAHTEPSEPVNGWVLNGMAEIRRLHRWDMASRPDNPSLNFTIHGALLDPGLSDLRVPDLLIDAPHSSAQAKAAFDFSTEPVAARQAGESPDFVELTSSQIDLADALTWLRAFHAGVPDSTSLRGFVGVRARFAGWPPNVSTASVTGGRAELLASGLAGPARAGPLDLRYDRGALSLQPATLTWSTAADRAAAAFKVAVSTRGRKALFPTWQLSGATDDARGIGAIAAALGLEFSRGWNLQGPLSCDLLWQDAQAPWNSQPTGTISIGATDGKSRRAALSAPFLNLPIEQIRARVEMKPALTQIALSSAKAFGANWTGTFERRPSDAEWQFVLSADRLSAADLDRWLDPRWRESFLDRMLPFLGPPATAASHEDLRGSGTLSVGEFALDPLAIRHLAGNLRIDGRTIEFSDAKGQFYGGQASGLLRATLSAIPSYHAEFSVSGMDAAAFSAATPALDGVSASNLDGDLSLDAKGSTRGDLIASIACKGNAQTSGLALRGLDLQQVLGALPASDTRITSASAAFTCAQRVIRFQRLSLALSGGPSLIGTGSIGFDRSLDLRFHDVGAAVDSTNHAAGFRLTGDLPSPQMSPLAPVARRR